MNNSKILTRQNPCEMTAVPGGIMDCIRSETIIGTSDSFLALNNSSFNFTKAPLSFPIQIAAFNRSVTLTAKPLSYHYEHQIMSFKSACTPLLRFLKTDAFTYEEAGNTCTTLFFDEDDNKLVAFCSIKCSSLKVKGGKLLNLCPSVEIAVLCVDDQYRYMGIGQAIITHTLQQIYKIKKIVGVQFVTLFALPDAVAFYQKLNFHKLSKIVKIFYALGHEGCIPMYLPLSHANSGA